MSINKRISGDYNITSVGSSDNVNITTHTVAINGNLVVSGATTTISTTNSAISDNIIVLNDGESGAGVTAGSAGILVDRGSSSNVALRWSEPDLSWQITTDGSTYRDIATTSGGVGFITEVADDTSPTLGGNLDVGGHAIVGSELVLDPTGNIKLQSNVQFVGASTVTVTANSAGAGGSGLFVDNTELVNKTKARKFAIIFG